MEGSEDEEEMSYIGQQNDQPDRQQDNQHDNQLQYSFEDQFKQLYELTPDPKRKEFLDDLFSFMTKRGTPVNRIPIMAKQVLDLFELYKLVVHHGGLVEVINKKIWREITKGLNLPSSITSAAFTLRSQYMKYLYPFECDRENLSTPEELQQAIDGNRREGRRLSNGQYVDVALSLAAGGSGISGNSIVGNNGSMGNGGHTNGGPAKGHPSNGGHTAHIKTETGGSGSGSAFSGGFLFNGGPSNGGPSNGRPTNSGLPYLGMTVTQPLSLVKRNSTATPSGASSSEEDSVPIHSLSRNPMLALASAQAIASAQAVALNLEPKRAMNGRQIDPNRDLHNNNHQNGAGSFKVNGSTVRHASSLSPSPSPSPSPPSSSSSSTSHNQGIDRNIPEVERILINAGMPAMHVKIDTNEGRDSTDSSLRVNMEINNMTYSGVLFPRMN
ncbi:AT-rich interactive domain-containing protein 1A isoform X2 [Tetranychus urticae]|uniref:ARID domain-containing protein n=2 Tax=Tetranychus urticae TaxID=32264 RepID=T1KE92_TETUR|nr:AT-rich interactive domain-containing protein 1A isoform X2 [Tetranychus urticae]